MSKRKKMQEKAEAERRAAMQRRREDDYGYDSDPRFTQIIQLPPIVQPVIMMPICTQMPNSPVRNTDDFDDFDDFDDDKF